MPWLRFAAPLVWIRFERGLERGAEVGAGEKVLMGAVEGVFEEALRPLWLGNAGVELGDLAFGYPLVIAQRRGRRSGAAGELADGQAGVVIGHRFPLT
jgi:hypothetical protein